MAIKSARGLQRLVDATVYSFKGLRAAWGHEEAFRQEILMVLVLVPSAFWLGRTTAQRILLLATCFLVLIVELLNSAIESVVDRIGEEDHPLSGRAKDMGSAAVLMSLIAAALVWGLVAWQRWTGGP
ncbi:MAG: diacylglycerol kinase [Desulfosarcinaceae bacterium]